MQRLSFKNVSKSFKTGTAETVILKNVSYTFDSTGFVCIYGKSGSGKTTILNLISGLEDASSGSINYMNKSINLMKDFEKVIFRRDYVSYVFQNYNLLDDLSVKEQIELYLTIRNQEYDEDKVLKRLKEFSLESLFNQRVAILSGGEKQRIAIVCAILSGSKILLLDEPTGALDKKNSLLIMNDIKRLSKECLIIMVSHNQELIKEYADTILALENGSLKEIRKGKPDANINLNKNPTVHRSIIPFLMKRFLKKNFLSNIVTLLVSIFAFSTLFVCASLAFSGQSLMNRSLLERGNAQVVSVSKKETRNESGAVISLTKSERPTFQDFDFIFELYDEVSLEYDLGALLSGSVTLEFSDETVNDILFLPTNSELITSLNEVLINNSLSEMIREDVFHIEYFKTFEFFLKDSQSFITDIFHFDHDFEIVEVCHEFSYLQSPTVYYSYPLWKEYLKTEYADTYSMASEKAYSWFDLVKNSDNSSVLSNYQLLILFSNNEDLLHFYDYELPKAGSYSLVTSAPHFFIRDSLATFYQAIFMGIVFFIAIIGVSTFFIFGIITYANYSDSEKEIFQMYVYGLSFKRINIVFYIQKITLAIIAFLSSVGFYMLLKEPLNNLINRYLNISNVLNPTYSSFITFLFLSFIVLLFLVILVIYLPLRFKRKENANRILRMRS